jgi:hypothetical protein
MLTFDLRSEIPVNHQITILKRAIYRIELLKYLARVT